VYSEKAQFWGTKKKKPGFVCLLKKSPILGTKNKPGFGFVLREAQFWVRRRRSPVLGTMKKKPSVVFALRLSLGVKNYLDSDNMIQGRRSSCHQNGDLLNNFDQ